MSDLIISNVRTDKANNAANIAELDRWANDTANKLNVLLNQESEEKTESTPVTSDNISSASYDDTEIRAAIKANTDALGGHTVRSDVPEGAVFTDTVYDDSDIQSRVKSLETITPSFLKTDGTYTLAEKDGAEWLSVPVATGSDMGVSIALDDTTIKTLANQIDVDLSDYNAYEAFMSMAPRLGISNKGFALGVVGYAYLIQTVCAQIDKNTQAIEQISVSSSTPYRVGDILTSTSSADPTNTYGGTWEKVDELSYPSTYTISDEEIRVSGWSSSSSGNDISFTVPCKKAHMYSSAAVSTVTLFRLLYGGLRYGWGGTDTNMLGADAFTAVIQGDALALRCRSTASAWYDTAGSGKKLTTNIPVGIYGHLKIVLSGGPGITAWKRTA